MDLLNRNSFKNIIKKNHLDLVGVYKIFAWFNVSRIFAFTMGLRIDVAAVANLLPSGKMIHNCGHFLNSDYLF